jgi:hypothetical protein
MITESGPISRTEQRVYAWWWMLWLGYLLLLMGGIQILFGPYVYFSIDVYAPRFRRFLAGGRTGIEGLFGWDIYGLSRHNDPLTDRLLPLLLALSLFCASQSIVYRSLGRHPSSWIEKRQPTALVRICLGLVAAWLTLGAFCLVLWLLGGRRLIFLNSSPRNLRLLLLFVTFFAIWFLAIARGRQQRAYYVRLRVLVRLLCAGGLLLTIAGFAVVTVYENSYGGTSMLGFTGIVVGVSVILWSLGIDCQIIRRYEQYIRPFLLRCADCGYELFGTLRAGGTTCPECGATIMPETMAVAGMTPELAPERDTLGPVS